MNNFIYHQQRNIHRYNGYVNKWIENERIGHAVRYDQPEIEYFFSYNDIIIAKDIKNLWSFRSEISIKKFF